MFNLLLTPSDYIFFTIRTDGEREELYDESRSIFSLRLFVPILCLIEPEGNREEKELTHDIGNFLSNLWVVANFVESTGNIRYSKIIISTPLRCGLSWEPIIHFIPRKILKECK